MEATVSFVNVLVGATKLSSSDFVHDTLAQREQNLARTMGFHLIKD